MVITGVKKSSRKILKKYWMDLYLEEHTNGKNETHEFVIIGAPDWTMSIPHTKNGKFLIVKQYRPAWEMVSFEFPAGRVNNGEEMMETVARELREETGYIAERHEMVLKLRQSTSTRQIVGIFKSFDLTYVGQDLDEEEDIEVIEVTKDEIQEFIDSGKMVQMASILAFQYIK